MAVQHTDATVLFHHIIRIQATTTHSRPTRSDIKELCCLALKVCPDSLLSAAPSRNGSCVAFKVRHGKHGKSQHRHARLIGTLDFCWLVLMLIAGCRLVSVPAGVPPFSYLRVEHPENMSPNMRIRLGRIIMDAPANQQVAFKGRGTFRSLLRSNQMLRAPSRKSDAKPKLGRAEALELSRQLYAGGERPPIEDVHAGDFVAAVRNMLAVADRFDGGPKLYPTEPAE
ncbi:hypothetical protein [Tardiphaga robiniae]|uniref:Uncharacterized protein n=1 Tax=Tardiphaga robiniae TaxID=943830 RepID=A0A7G6TWY9_9BRAD|nr:hypothetical protein [Tardiphaga robiniae]QND71271.1 hypothetical protein HB776_08490 [Tardiphaga robiniae]